VIQNIEDSR